MYVGIVVVAVVVVIIVGIDRNKNDDDDDDPTCRWTIICSPCVFGNVSCNVYHRYFNVLAQVCD